MSANLDKLGAAASVRPCSHLFCGAFVPFEFFPGPVLKVLSVSLAGNLPNRSEDLSVEEEDLLPSHELPGEGEKQITTKYPPAPSPQTTWDQKSPLKRNKTKTKARPGGLLGQCTPIRPREAARRGGGGCGSQVSGTVPQKTTGDTAPSGRREPGSWENPGYLLQSQRPGRQAGGRHGSRLVSKIGSGAWG